jgi:hypothetical protein
MREKERESVCTCCARLHYRHQNSPMRRNRLCAAQFLRKIVKGAIKQIKRVNERPAGNRALMREKESEESGGLKGLAKKDLEIKSSR